MDGNHDGVVCMPELLGEAAIGHHYCLLCCIGEGSFSTLFFHTFPASSEHRRLCTQFQHSFQTEHHADLARYTPSLSARRVHANVSVGQFGEVKADLSRDAWK